MKNYDFNDFLKSVKHFSRNDKVETAKMKLVELDKVKSGPNRADAQQLKEKVSAFLSLLI